MIDTKNKYFLPLVIFTAIFVEACAAFFSVFGLSKLFSGASIAVIIMASGLELAKVITASFLYRFWKGMHWFMKTYMSLAVFVLILITSMGIYGFLNNAFQGSTLGLEKNMSTQLILDDRLENLKEERRVANAEKKDLYTAMNDHLSGLSFADSTNYLLVNKRKNEARSGYIQEINKKDSYIAELNTKIDSLTNQKMALDIETIDSGADVGPIVFTAKLLNTDVGVVVQYLIFIFIAVFDPLAIALVIAVNKMLIESGYTTSWTGEPKKDEKISNEEVRDLSLRYNKVDLDQDFWLATPKEGNVPHQNLVNERTGDIIEPTEEIIEKEPLKESKISAIFKRKRMNEPSTDQPQKEEKAGEPKYIIGKGGKKYPPAGHST